ncbi:uncharacterized protein LOC110459911 isoform X3 [Mizuhopecten yessoensis]|uniref:uncharacterized protein LOC110459911 isoform X3 n=1 Tax=Mizuhopecten yessoensis TaxID=6573 RepID=UPI000B458585|nr:uncharacterized protein LOC110459911 isoform X3 [Mizuhopecten yessoensis]
MGGDATGKMAAERSKFFFYDQSDQQAPGRRYRKMPEDLPESLKYARLNPKVAAYLASKEREAQKQAEQDPFGDGLGKKSLLPHINSAVTHIKNHLDSSLSNDEGSQKFLFEDTKASSGNILQQLSRYLYFYDDISSHIPRGLEYQLMAQWKDLTNDVIFIPREWQTAEGRDQYLVSLREVQSDEDSVELGTDVPIKVTGRSSVDKLEGKSKTKRCSTSNKNAIPEIIKDEVDGGDKPIKRSDSRMSNMSVSQNRNRLESKTGRASRDQLRSNSRLQSAASSRKHPEHDDLFFNIAETPSDPRTVTGTNQPVPYGTTISVSMVSCETKGWIVNKGRQDEIDKNTILEYCIQILQETMKATKEQRIKDIDNGYDREVQVRFYGDAKKEAMLKYRRSPLKTAVKPIYKGGKPRIPPVFDERHEGKDLLQATHLDGSSVVYYPSGYKAVVYTAAGFGRPGHYLLAYDDGPESKMLACFTPSGKGVCYGENGVIRVLVTEKGGHEALDDGSILRKWKWPTTQMKTFTPVTFQMNHSLLFRCSGQQVMSMIFNCTKEVARFSLSATPGAVESKPGDENEQLLTASFPFSSRAAKDLMRLFAPKPSRKNKNQKKKHHGRSHHPEIQKLLEFSLQYDAENDKDLAKLQRKAKGLVEEWMEHYRLAVGLTSPFLSTMIEYPEYSTRKRNIKSAQLADNGQLSRRANMELVSPVHSRVPSAPLVKARSRSAKSLVDEFEVMESRKKSAAPSNVKFEDDTTDAGGDVSPTAIAMFERLAHSAGKHSSRGIRTPVSSAPLSRQYTIATTNPNAELLSMMKSPCPVAIRQAMLGLERPLCRCSRHIIPQIMDLEYDTFIQTEVPDTQIVVIEVISSIFPYSTAAEKMVEEIYTSCNRNRTKPCVQCRGDMFRLLQYDITTAAEGSDHTQPLLLTRHNVVPGMFLMYLNGKLLFCDHIFNGYGNARKDFRKQIMKSRVQAMQGYSLPRDFRFSPTRGRSGMRSAWGGEIGGTGVDKFGHPGTGTSLDSALVPIKRPGSSSADSGKDMLDQVKKLESTRVITMSLSPGGFHHTNIDVRRHLSAPGRRMQGTVT